MEQAQFVSATSLLGELLCLTYNLSTFSTNLQSAEWSKNSLSFQELLSSRKCVCHKELIW